MLSIKGLFVTLRINDIWHKTHSIMCHYTDIVIPNVIILRVITRNVVAPIFNAS